MADTDTYALGLKPPSASLLGASPAYAAASALGVGQRAPNPLPQDSSLGAAASTSALELWKWLQNQRADSVRQGLLDPNTGLPTQAGLVDAARQTAQGVMMGTTAPGDVPPPGIVAYHGSPADFNRFDDRFIGTGEGAQAYGRGHYFGGAEETGRSYRDALATDPRDTLNNYLRGIMNFHAPDDPAITSDAIKNGLSNHDDLAMRQLGGNDAAVKDITTILQGYDPNSGSHSQAAMDAYGRLDKAMPQGSPGHMYQVNIKR